MTTEDDILAALDKPRADLFLLKMLELSSKSVLAGSAHAYAQGKVKFDIKSGLWSKA